MSSLNISLVARPKGWTRFPRSSGCCRACWLPHLWHVMWRSEAVPLDWQTEMVVFIFNKGGPVGELQLPEDHDTQTLCQGAGEFILRGMVGNVGCLAHCYGPFGPCITIPGARSTLPAVSWTRSWCVLDFASSFIHTFYGSNYFARWWTVALWWPQKLISVFCRWCGFVDFTG